MKNGYNDTIILMIIILSSKILESVQSFTQNKDSSAFLLHVKYLKSLLESIQSFTSSKYLKSLLESVQSFTSSSSQYNDPISSMSVDVQSFLYFFGHL